MNTLFQLPEPQAFARTTTVRTHTRRLNSMQAGRHLAELKQARAWLEKLVADYVLAVRHHRERKALGQQVTRAKANVLRLETLLFGPAE